MFDSILRKRKIPDLINLDWSRILQELQAYNPKDGNFYIITVNKGKDDEYRTRFLTYNEAMDIIKLALEKQGRRIPS